MAEKIRKIGPSDGLHFEFHFDDMERLQKPHQAWGGALLFFANDVIWASETERGDEEPFDWSWFDLFEYLTNYWPWLIFEQHYPIPVNPLYPGMLLQEAERRWQDLSDALVDDEETKVYAFSERHDLAMALKGAFFPSVVIMRQGKDCLISLAALKKTYVRPFEEVIETLESVGNFLADIISKGESAYADQVLKKWGERNEVTNEKKVDILSGMEPSIRKRLEGGNDPLKYWEAKDNDSELLAVARMTSVVFSQDVQATLIQKIRAIGLRETDNLDAISERAAVVVDQSLRPYEQGYLLAEWLRDELNIDARREVDPQRILAEWNIEIQKVELPSSAANMDAVAAWGTHHGPVILLNNSDGARCSHAFGERATLAHEICHLLVDREGGLPMAEVLGGMTPKALEQRAGAFAAEFLLPRSLAIEALRESDSVLSAIDILTKDFKVSKEVAAWQIYNSDEMQTLDPLDQDELARIVLSYDIGRDI